MSKPLVFGPDVLRHLEQEVGAAGSQKAVAEAAGVSQAFLTDVLKGRRALTGPLVKWLGYERVIAYRRLRNG